MQTDSDICEEIRDALPASGDVALVFLERVEDALKVHPESAVLWSLLGDLIQLGPLESPPLDEARQSYERAIQVEPAHPNGHEGLAFYLYAVADDAERSISHFRRCLELSESAVVRAGLAEALLELGRLDEAEEVLSSAPEPSSAKLLEAWKELRRLRKG